MLLGAQAIAGSLVHLHLACALGSQEPYSLGAVACARTDAKAQHPALTPKLSILH